MTGLLYSTWLRTYNGFRDSLRHEVTVPAGAEGRPGERLLAPSRPLHLDRRTACGSRQDFAVLVGAGGSTLQCVCFGRVADHEDPLESAWFSIGNVGRMGLPLVDGVHEDEVAGQRAWRYAIQLRSGRLTEWKFEYDGWLFGVGVLASPRDDEAAALRLARRCLDTWRWTDRVAAYAVAGTTRVAFASDEMR